jgi:hypothetical protein
MPCSSEPTSVVGLNSGISTDARNAPDGTDGNALTGNGPFCHFVPRFSAEGWN